MAGPNPQHRLGIALVLAAAVAWSTAPFFTRLLPYRLLDDPVLARAIRRRPHRGPSGPDARAAPACAIPAGIGKSGWLVASLSTLAMVTFIPALQLTSVSNVAIIIATGPLRRRRARLALASAKPPDGRPCWQAPWRSAASPSLSVARSAGPDGLGIALACLMTLAIAAMTVVISRHRDTPMVAAAALSNMLGSIVSVPFAHGIAIVTGSGPASSLRCSGSSRSRWG